MTITLLSIGKTKHSAYASLEEEYSKRIRGRFSFTTRYVKNEKELLQELSSISATIVLLDENGSVMNTQEFARFIDAQATQAHDIVFVIGDAPGFSEAVRAVDADLIALSELTFPHELARVVLIEQVYRAMTILDGHPYHK